jgi:hypothetical protein
MRAFCPNNAEHKRFVTTAHILEEWVVDEAGNWIKTEQALEITHGPDPYNTWVCYECGEPATVVV